MMGRTYPTPGLADVPTIDQVATDPARASALSSTALQSLLCRCLTAQTAIMGALVKSSVRTPDISSEPDSLLDVAAAAARLGMSKDWLYRRAKKLPFCVPQGRALRFSSHGIDRYIERRQSRISV